MTKKRFFALGLTLALSLALLAGCSGGQDQETDTPAPTPTESATPAPTPTPEPEDTPEPTETLPVLSSHPVEEEKPSSSPKPSTSSKPSASPTPSLSPSPSPTPSSVDLAGFYAAVTGSYSMPSLELADETLLENYYSGLSAVSTEQCLVYINMMSMNNGEFALVQVKNSADVSTVKNILQARIDYMVGDGNGPGGAWYPEAMDTWEQQSRVVSNGNYVMMVVSGDCDSIVSDFNALFA